MTDIIKTIIRCMTWEMRWICKLLYLGKIVTQIIDQNIIDQKIIENNSMSGTQSLIVSRVWTNKPRFISPVTILPLVFKKVNKFLGLHLNYFHPVVCGHTQVLKFLICQDSHIADHKLPYAQNFTSSAEATLKISCVGEQPALWLGQKTHHQNIESSKPESKCNEVGK